MDAFIATILPTGFNFNPSGWQFCAGQLLPVNQNQAAFSLVSTYYGGDGRTTFGVPDLRGRVPIGWGQKDGGTPNYEIGKKYGNDTRTLNVTELPSHTHAATFAPTTSDVPIKTGQVTGDQKITAKFEVSAAQGSAPAPKNDTYLAASTSALTKIYNETGTDLVALKGVSATLEGTPNIPALDATVKNVVTGGSVTINPTGSGAPIDIRPSSQAINFIFCIYGIYPSRD